MRYYGEGYDYARNNNLWLAKILLVSVCTSMLFERGKKESLVVAPFVWDFLFLDFPISVPIFWLSPASEAI